MATNKIVIKPPTKKEEHDAGKQLPAGHPSAGRVLAEASKASKSPPAKEAAPKKPKK